MLRDRKRVIGTLEERIKLHQAAGDVLEKMGVSGIFSEEDIVSLQTAILGFLREPEPRLLGICSYSRNHRKATNAGERTWRILVKRSMIHDNDGELEATLYHEFLHAILGSDEGHGSVFQKYEAFWPLRMVIE